MDLISFSEGFSSSNEVCSLDVESGSSSLVGFFETLSFVVHGVSTFGFESLPFVSGLVGPFDFETPLVCCAFRQCFGFF